MARPTFARRTWSIRSRVVVLLLAPLLPLLGMWAFSTAVSLSAAGNLLDAQTNAEEIGLPASQVVFDLQAERKMSAAFVTTGQADADLKPRRQVVDKDIADLRVRAAKSGVRDAMPPETQNYLTELTAAFDQLPTARAAIDTRQFDRMNVMAQYDGMIDKAFALYESISGLVDDHNVARAAGTVVSLTEAREMYNREDALVSAVLAGGGTFAAGERAYAVRQIGAQRAMYQIAARELHPDDRAGYDKAITGDPYKRLQAAENRIADATRMNAGVNGTQWNADWTALNSQLSALETDAANRVVASADPIVTAIVLRLALVGAAGLILIAGLIYLAARLARSIIRRIADLRTQALEVAEHKLPDVVRRLRHGEAVDVDAEAPPIEGAADELAQLAGAFTEVQRTAVASAVQEATLRAGLNQVFLNLGRRSQVLVHRQLSLLDAMERRVTDPQELEELYRIDHLSARMRRHAEDLVILAGAVPGRGWRNPVPLHDVLRSAVSEVEEYTRITLIPLPDLALLGRAVSDVVHLLAELLENATGFSPRDTHVRLSGQLVPNGFAVEIEDRGVGMPPEAIEEANARLAEPPDFDPAHSARLGLFVVSRLAARHGIKVTLRSSAYGGITAVALLPREVIVEDRQDGEILPVPSEHAGAHRIEGKAVAALTATTAEIPQSRAAVATLDAPPRPQSDTQFSPEGLPIRQRQASFAPPQDPALQDPANQAPALLQDPAKIRDTAQILGQDPRINPDPAGILEEAGEPTGQIRSPEATRSILSSLQAGTNRGRIEAQRERRAESAEPTEEPT
jgi:signal transduction histidine kinase